MKWLYPILKGLLHRLWNKHSWKKKIITSIFFVELKACRNLHSVALSLHSEEARQQPFCVSGQLLFLGCKVSEGLRNQRSRISTGTYAAGMEAYSSLNKNGEGNTTKWLLLKVSHKSYKNPVCYDPGRASYFFMFWVGTRGLLPRSLICTISWPLLLNDV